ncbi:MAG: hypothetical protein GY794_09410 [bacterium]|nr:hypothetical protein [bacterium]
MRHPDTASCMPQAQLKDFMKKEIAGNIRRAMISPLFIAAVIVMAANDHLLKGTGVIPASVTGKLSDFAFLFFVPIVIAFVFRVRSYGPLVVIYVTIGILFSAINLSGWFSQLVERIFGLAMIPMHLWPDPTDLLALMIMPLSIWFVHRRRTAWRIELAGLLRCVIAVTSLVACAATSPHTYRIRPTHEPVYMSWDEFRSSVEVLPPRKIMKRGKIYVKDKYLYVNEPNKGIHVVDNSDPNKPVQKCFISIPGNIDLAIKGSILYADSYVDMLVFALTINPEDIVMIRRMKDLFECNPYQDIPSDSGAPHRFWPDSVDKDKGVVVGWRVIQER